MPKAKKKPSTRLLKWVVIAFAILLLVPPLEVLSLRFIDPPRTRPMLLYQLGSLVSRPARRPLLYRWVNLPRVSETFLKHVWIAEDQRFFQHSGFDWKEIDVAMQRAERRGTAVRGASTITMQCARSTFLWQGRSWIRKGIEAYYTFWMEALLSKRRIIELYVNVIEMGRGIYGVEAAARHYFGVPAQALTREQSALLAAVLPNPRGWNPARPGVALTNRQRRILFRERQSEFPRHLLQRE